MKRLTPLHDIWGPPRRPGGYDPEYVTGVYQPMSAGDRVAKEREFLDLFHDIPEPYRPALALRNDPVQRRRAMKEAAARRRNELLRIRRMAVEESRRSAKLRKKTVDNRKKALANVVRVPRTSQRMKTIEGLETKLNLKSKLDQYLRREFILNQLAVGRNNLEQSVTPSIMRKPGAVSLKNKTTRILSSLPRNQRKLRLVKPHESQLRKGRASLKETTTKNRSGAFDIKRAVVDAAQLMRKNQTIKPNRIWGVPENLRSELTKRRKELNGVPQSLRRTSPIQQATLKDVPPKLRAMLYQRRKRMPIGWEKYRTNNGVPYYYNTVKGVTTWYLPNNNLEQAAATPLWVDNSSMSSS